MLNLFIWAGLFLGLAAPKTINFTSDQVLTEPIIISENTVINGNNFFIDAKNVDYVFDVKDKVELVIKDVQFKNLNHFAKTSGKIDMVNSKGRWRIHHSEISNN